MKNQFTSEYCENLAIGEHLHNWAKVYASNIALVDAKTRLTYTQLDHEVNQVAVGFATLGIAAGDRVLVQLPNTIAFVTTCFALFRLGAIPILAMPSQRVHDISALCELAEPVAYIIPDKFLGFNYRDLAEQIQKQHPKLQHVIVDGKTKITAVPHSITPPAPNAIALLLLSGGTTGTPKLIPRTHADYIFNARASAQLCGLNTRSVYLAALPIAHNFPLACPGILGTLSVGGTVVLAKTPSCDETFPLIAREKVTFTSLVPSLVQLWLQARTWDKTDLSSLEFIQVGGAQFSPTLAKQIKPVLGCRLQQVFGMAEGLLCYTRFDDPEDEIINTQGRPLSADDEIRIINEKGEAVAAGEIGELLTRGPYTIRGYYEAHEYNQQAFTSDGFYRTGDLVRMNAAGNMIVMGRLKDHINRAGEKIAAAEIESHLRDHPAIRDAAVVPIADGQLGERICAFLQADAREVNLTHIHDFLRERGLSRYKFPDQLEFIQAWPLTAVGKIDKRQLVDLANKQQNYHEQKLTIQNDALTIINGLAKHYDQQFFMLYEHEDEWSVGIGVAAEITINAKGVTTLQYADKIQTWEPQQVCAAIPQALKALSIKGWRAYGNAAFELARQIYQLPHKPTSSQTQLRLVIPRMEIRIQNQSVCIRALDQTALQELLALLQSLDLQINLQTNLIRDEHPPLFKISKAEEEDYQQRVAAAIKAIHANQYQKIILSRTIQLNTELDIVASYLAGRRGNTPARSFLLNQDGFKSAGFSPEIAVRVDAEGWVTTQPLAGTRMLGATEKEEERLRVELLNNTKEVAEHAVSAKVAYDELQQVCASESVRISDFMYICRRGSVQHLASTVKGQLQSQYSAWDAFAAIFPAVTASGIPKREAIEAIGQFEAERRLYSGCVMIVDSNGTLDAALVLRSFYQEGAQAWLRSGAGIVALSTPERELQETYEKLRSVSLHLVPAQSSKQSESLADENSSVETCAS